MAASKLPKFDYYENPELIRSFRGNLKPISKVAFNPNLKYVASAGEDGAVRVWPFKSDMRPLKFETHSGPVHAVCFNDDGSYLASGGADGKIGVTKNNAKNAKNENFAFKAHSAPVKSVSFSRDSGRLLTSGDDKVIKLWNVQFVRGADTSRRASGHGFVRSFTGHTDWVLDSKFSPDNRVVGSVCTKSVRLWDIATGSEIVTFKHVGLQNTSVCFHPDGNYLAVGSENRHIKIWDMRSQKLAQDYLLPTAVTSLDFHPSGVVLASSQLWDQTLNNSSLNLFDIRQSRCVFEIEGIQDSLNSVAFSPDGEYITAGGKNKLVYVWKSNLQLRKPRSAPEEFQPRPDKEVDIGGAISLQKHLEAYEDRDKNEVYEQISTSLENLVLKINSISENLGSLDYRLQENERRAGRLFNLIQIKDSISLGLSKGNAGSYKTNFGSPSDLLNDEDVIRYDPMKDHPQTDYQYSASNLPATMNTKDLFKGDSMPVVNTEPENPFRGGHLLLDSVNSRASDFLHPEKPGLASIIPKLPRDSEEPRPSEERSPIDMDDSPADSPEKSMVITKKQEEIQFFQEDVPEIHHEDHDFRDETGEEEEEEDPDAGFVITQQNEELRFGQPQEGDIGRIMKVEVGQEGEEEPRDEEEEEAV